MKMDRLSRTLLIGFVIVAITLLPAFAGDKAEDVLGTLYMTSTVATGTAVSVPPEAAAVGNLVVQYSFDSSDWTYASLADIVIPRLGEEEGTLYLRALYYGNEPEDYYCSVAFKSDGWRTAGARLDAYGTSGTEAVLPISFSDLRIDYTEVSALSGSAAFNSGAQALEGISVLPGSSADSFTMFVPVQKPINGTLVATLQATWPEGYLPSGDYEADIQVEVSANT